MTLPDQDYWEENIVDRIEPIPWRGFSVLDKLIVVFVPLAAIAIAAIPFMDEAFLRRVARILKIRPLFAWLINDNGAVILTVGLLLFLALFLLWKRRQLINDKRLWYGTGCPRCKERELVRVSRQRGDRLYALIGVPAYRFACRHCVWRGLRIARREWTPELEAQMEASLARFDLSPPVEHNRPSLVHGNEAPTQEAEAIDDAAAEDTDVAALILADDLAFDLADLPMPAEHDWMPLEESQPEPVGSPDDDADDLRLL